VLILGVCLGIGGGVLIVICIALVLNHVLKSKVENSERKAQNVANSLIQLRSARVFTAPVNGQSQNQRQSRGSIFNMGSLRRSSLKVQDAKDTESVVTKEDAVVEQQRAVELPVNTEIVELKKQKSIPRLEGDVVADLPKLKQRRQSLSEAPSVRRASIIAPPKELSLTDKQRALVAYRQLINELNKMELTRKNLKKWARKLHRTQGLKEKLWDIVMFSKGENLVGSAAAKAISILNRYGESFSGRDLSEVDIADADLTNAILHLVELYKANLTNVIAINAEFEDSNLSESKTEGMVLELDPKRGLLKTRAMTATLSWKTGLPKEVRDFLARLNRFICENNVKQFQFNTADTLVSYDSQGLLSLYDTVTGRVEELYKHGDKSWLLRHIAVSDDENLVATSFQYRAKVAETSGNLVKIHQLNLFDKTTNKVRGFQLRGETIDGLAIDRRRIVTIGSGGIKLWEQPANPEENELTLVNTFPKGPEKLKAMCIGNQGSIATYCDDGIITVRSAAGVPTGSISIGTGISLKSLAMNKAGTLIIGGGEEGVITIWERQPKRSGDKIKLFTTISAYRDPVTHVKISDDGKRLLSCNDRMIIKIWDLSQCESGDESDSEDDVDLRSNKALLIHTSRPVLNLRGVLTGGIEGLSDKNEDVILKHNQLLQAEEDHEADDESSNSSRSNSLSPSSSMGDLKQAWLDGGYSSSSVSSSDDDEPTTRHVVRQGSKSGSAFRAATPVEPQSIRPISRRNTEVIQDDFERATEDQIARELAFRRQFEREAMQSSRTNSAERRLDHLDSDSDNEDYAEFLREFFQDFDSEAAEEVSFHSGSKPASRQSSEGSVIPHVVSVHQTQNYMQRTVSSEQIAVEDL